MYVLLSVLLFYLAWSNLPSWSSSWAILKLIHMDSMPWQACLSLSPSSSRFQASAGQFGSFFLPLLSLLIAVSWFSDLREFAKWGYLPPATSGSRRTGGFHYPCEIGFQEAGHEHTSRAWWMDPYSHTNISTSPITIISHTIFSLILEPGIFIRKANLFCSTCPILVSRLEMCGDAIWYGESPYVR